MHETTGKPEETGQLTAWPADPPEPSFDLRRDFFLVIRYTRNWLHYGFMALIFVCVLVGAVKGLLARGL
ncbi:MAG: hypothetical protein K2X35_18955 [Bryobacteraceae bacterium]|nr:hypothetical protein [Bryobacteraceae bacterium]